MTDEAKLQRADHGLAPTTAGWFVVNLDEARWIESPHFGAFCRFEGEGEARFGGLGVNVHVLEPGQAACRYHRENQQEAFLVLEGECRLIVEGEERRLRRWDFVHCPPGTNHVFVGGDAGRCAILMMGSRSGAEELCYPVEPAAARFGASAETETHDPREAYAGHRDRSEIPSPWPLAEP